jgi:hypothetical protein
MAKLIEARDVEHVIRRHFPSESFKLSAPKKLGETGPDIEATSEGSTYFVEVIGFQEHPPIRSREFYECFFRVISRDRNNPEDILVMALPIRFKNGMRQRVKQYSVAWEKLGQAFPNLEVWYVDTEPGKVEKYPWSNPF